MAVASGNYTSFVQIKRPWRVIYVNISSKTSMLELLWTHLWQ